MAIGGKMPYDIVKNHPECKSGFAVISRKSGRLIGCHETREKAIQQQRAVYAAEARETENK